MHINLDNPTERQTTAWAGTLAQAQDAAEMLISDPAYRCPNCDNILNLDIWEFGDGSGQMMEVCECGFVRFDDKRIVIEHELAGDFG